MAYDIFISYKRKSLATANNLYYRLTMRGYSAFFDLEEMGRDNFNVQLLNYIENAKDVFVLLEEGSLDACKQGNWKDDWFCIEIEHALKTKRNIIPILIGGFKMPGQNFFPDELKELSLKNAPEFSFSFFEEYLNKIIEKGYITSKAEFKDQSTSIFKFYSNENCQVFKEGKLVCSLEGMSDEPYYLPVQRKGDYRFKCKNSITAEEQILKEHIDVNEEKEIDIQWVSHVCIDSIPTPQKSYFSTSQTVIPVLSGPQSFVFGDTIEINVDTPVNKAVWEIYCGTECLYKSNTITTNKVLKLYENEAKIRFIMNSQVSKVYKDKTEQLKVRYSQSDNQNICAELTIDKYSHKGNVSYGYTKSSSPLKVNEGIANKIAAPMLIGPKQNYFVYYETIVINVQNPVKKAVWEIYTDSCCAYKSNSINPAWGEKVIIKEFESNEKIRFKIARTIGDGYSYSAQKVLIRYYQSDNQNISSELALTALN